MKRVGAFLVCASHGRLFDVKTTTLRVTSYHLRPIRINWESPQTWNCHLLLLNTPRGAHRRQQWVIRGAPLTLSSRLDCLIHNINTKGRPNSAIMAPAAASEPTYRKDEKVFCFHHELLYEAKVTDVKPNEGDDAKSGFQYKIHYKGWKNT
jgi:hypothetical protein